MNNLYPYFSYDFEGSTFEGTSGALWTGMYNLIANLNVLLEKCDSEGSVLYPNYYPYVKGEALALRAMLHFDLLRLYGPEYSDANFTACSHSLQSAGTITVMFGRPLIKVTSSKAW